MIQALCLLSHLKLARVLNSIRVPSGKHCCNTPVLQVDRLLSGIGRQSSQSHPVLLRTAVAALEGLAKPSQQLQQGEEYRSRHVLRPWQSWLR